MNLENGRSEFTHGARKFITQQSDSLSLLINSIIRSSAEDFRDARASTQLLTQLVFKSATWHFDQ